MPVPRLAAYGLISTALAGAVVGGAITTRPNFYAAAVSIGRSGGSLIVLANFCLFLGIMLGVCFKRLFFGDLRPVEYEHMFERLWIFLTESLLALTIFREDFSASFLVLYSALVFLKCFHWISADRVDYIDQVPPPGPPAWFHVRLGAVLALLTTLDVLLFLYTMEHVMVVGVSAMVLFASEFAILVAAICGTWARYAVGVADLHRARGRVDAPAWEEKSMHLFYIDLAVDFAKLLTYLVFFIVIFLNYGLPVHILRDVYMTLRSFLARGADLVRYRRATRNMDELYPNATAEELARLGDHTCIICREEMVAERPAGAEGPNETPKKLACGHVFHFHCLRSWLERQQICPTCRRDVLAPTRHTPPPPPPVPAPAPQELPENDADRMRSAFEEYFRLPGVNGDAPAHVPPPQPPRTASAPPDTEHDDARLQRGIWGAPIVPGRFAVPPLGAAPQEPGTSRAVTPAASQAPVVFSSTGSLREPTPPSDDDVPLRQAAAAAALRRFNAVSDKGKGRARDSDAFDTPATHRVMLTPHALPPPHSGIARTPEAAHAALDLRLKALRDVDEVVWSLVGELSRLRSAWEAEDEMRAGMKHRPEEVEHSQRSERNQSRETTDDDTPLFSRSSEGPSTE
ncbi:hypothetical protein CspHIS471_0303300 [Cutaneotrichosporon sp. HIS471]|nr:hypothetical protein CspHIS471_0303300 [Cutaneotrichosporon sp. HIS471]